MTQQHRLFRYSAGLMTGVVVTLLWMSYVNHGVRDTARSEGRYQLSAELDRKGIVDKATTNPLLHLMDSCYTDGGVWDLRTGKCDVNQ